MALFEQKTWTDRQVQYPSRRKLTNVSTQEERTVLVERNEGIIYNEGDLFDATNINDLEERIARAFDEVEQSLDARVNLYYPVGKIFMAVTDLHLEDANQQVFPGTTWEKLQNRVLLPVPESQESGQTGGNSSVSITPKGSVTITSAAVQAHALTEAEMPPHSHTFAPPPVEGYYIITSMKSGTWYGEGSGAGYVITDETSYAGGGSHSHGFSGSASFTGKAGSVSNMQSYVTVFAWRRLT
jgi:hypothetical protein